MFQSRGTALHLNLHASCFGIGKTEGILDEELARTFYIYSSTAVETRLSQNGLVAATASQHHAASTDT